MMGFTREQVDEIAAKIKAMPKVEPPAKDLTKQEVIKALSKEIKSLRTKGYTMDQIASSLKGFGLDISTPTLRNYLQASKGKTKKLTPVKDISLPSAVIEKNDKGKINQEESSGKFVPKASRREI